MALLVIATLPLQAVSTAMQRAWMPAHYHLAASPERAHPARGHHPDSARAQLPQPHAHAHGQADRVAAAGHDHDRQGPRPPIHDHATLGRHHHDRSEPAVVYVDAPDPAAALSVTPPSGFDNFWTILPSPVVLLAAQGGGKPLTWWPPIRVPHRSDVPRRPPRQ
ncbi:MAG: hypothetical protein KY442_07915 [Proteobacteria bacterium]|nr:hypothetical protein [Pseudomonadota bacterium]